MIFEHLPGLQVDAFLLRTDTTTPFLFLHIPFHRTSIIIFHWCFTSWKGLTGRASVMHSPFFLSRGHQIHTAEPLSLSTLHLVRSKLIRGQPFVADKYRDIRERRQTSRRRLLSIGSMTRWEGTDARPRSFGGLRHLAPTRALWCFAPRFGSSCISRLTLLFTPIDPPACTPKLYLHWASLHFHVCVRQHTGIFVSPVLLGTHSRPQVFFPSQSSSGPPLPTRRHFLH